jgi:hypothetical protein
MLFRQRSDGNMFFLGSVEHFSEKIVLLSAELSDILVFSKAHSQG